jgi:hypothetical protein
MDTTTAKRILNARVSMLRAKDPRIQALWNKVIEELRSKLVVEPT